MDSLAVEKIDGEWVAMCTNWPTVGRGATELDAVKSLARGLRNQLVKVAAAIEHAT